jgi:hypothetical protein
VAARQRSDWLPAHSHGFHFRDSPTDRRIQRAAHTDSIYQNAMELSRHRSTCTAVLTRPVAVAHLLPTGAWQRGHC